MQMRRGYEGFCWDWDKQDATPIEGQRHAAGRHGGRPADIGSKGLAALGAELGGRRVGRVALAARARIAFVLQVADEHFRDR